jgi:hypothetical protein
MSGACAQGYLACNGTVTQCLPARAPVQEICGDGTDNNCDGLTDEAGCTARESCTDAEDVGRGGTFYGNLDTAASDVQAMCAASPPTAGDHVYRITLPMSPSVYGMVSASGMVSLSVYQGSCGSGAFCMGSTGSFGYGAGGSTFYVVVKGQGPYALSIAANDNSSTSQTSCSVGDLDGDGQTICMGDCNEGAANVHGGALELCDGIDNDCNGQIDDLHGSCSTGLPGVCNQGTSSCSGSSTVCQANVVPGQLSDYCSDGLDNDCDGTVDGPSCLQVPAGEVCSLAIDMGNGGTFSGDFASFHSDLQTGCGTGADVVYRLDVPNDGHHFANVRSGGNVYLSVNNGSCGGGPGMCFLGGSSVSLGQNGGTFYFVLQGTGAYTLSAAVRDTMSGTCSVGDNDGDSYTLCDDDCDDSNAATHPGALELCDNVDNNCNGSIDDLSGSCSTGMPGECGLGVPSCAYPSPQPVCNAILTPGQKPDYCGDGKDNNCDGAVDEAGCVTLPPGDVCDLAIDIGQGGTISGSTAGMNADALVNCGASADPDVVYKLSVPAGTSYNARFWFHGADAKLWGGGCDVQQSMGCLLDGYQTMLSGGTYYLAVKSALPTYWFSVGLRDMMSPISCFTADADGDGMTLCDNDCDDTDANTHPGAPEICGDGRDNDCDGEVDNGCP